MLCVFFSLGLDLIAHGGRLDARLSHGHEKVLIGCHALLNEGQLRLGLGLGLGCVK